MPAKMELLEVLILGPRMVFVRRAIQHLHNLEIVSEPCPPPVQEAISVTDESEPPVNADAF